MTQQTQALPKSLLVEPSKDAQTLLDAAIVWITVQRPYFSTLLFSLRKVWVAPEVVPTVAVDHGVRMYLNPDFIEKTGQADIRNLAGVIIHEVNHVIRGHAERRMDREPTRWNMAADIEINPDILSDGIHLPNDCLLPQVFDWPTGKSAEEYYALFPEDQMGYPSGGGDGEDHGGSDVSDEDDDEQDGKNEGDEQQDGDGGAENGQNTKGVTAGSCGSIVTGQDGSVTEAAADEAGVKPMSSAGVQVAIQATAEAVREYASKNPGTLPASLERWAEEHNKPVVNWRKELQAAVIQATNIAPGVGMQTYKLPSRRHRTQAGSPVFPRSITLRPRIGVVIDTSGSMTDEQLGQALSETQGILQAVGCTDVRVFPCDTQVEAAKQIYSVEQIELTGGGGTDMRAGIAAALDGGRPAEVVIVLTDGYTPWPMEYPGTPVVVALLDGDMDVPDWARKVVVDEDFRQAA